MKNKLFWFCTLLLSACSTEKPAEKEAILRADREAPLGWIYLNIYKDHSFEFISRGIRGSDTDVYAGTVRQSGDTLFFQYTDSIPKAGKTAIIHKGRVSYIDGAYPESVEIKLNKMKP